MSTINQIKTNARRALVTGASSGIGAIYADRLARRGFDLILVARNAERLNTVANRIAATTGREVEILRADLSDAADRRLVETRLREDSAIEILVNNAGFGSVTHLLRSNVDAMEDMI